MSKRLLNQWFLLAAAAGAACAMDMTGCGGSSGSGPVSGGPDAAGADATGDGNVAADDSGNGTDSGLADGPPASSDDAAGDATALSDASPDSASDAAGPVDASGDASSCPSGTACSNAGTNGICAADACGACDSGSTSAGIDTACTSAYGGSSNPYVCSAGACVAGNCNSNSDCATPTPTCGFSTPNVCGGCTEDSQCPSGDICDTLSGDPNLGKCVAATAGCASVTSSGVTCSLNASDECCTGSCVSGNCCLPALSATFCGAGETCKAETPGETVGGGICSKCDPVTGTNPTYFVDPVGGNDATGTGNKSVTASCAFQTITRALQVIGSSAPAGTKISVLNAAGTGTVSVQGVATGTPGTGQERFPIVLPSNVTLVSSGGAIVIKVPAPAARGTTAGVVLAGNPSAVTGAANASLTIDGQSKSATYGVTVLSPGATLSRATIQNFAADGIAVGDLKTTASALTIGAGVQSIGNGVDGLAVTGTSTVSITGTPELPTQFNGNLAHGIYVRGAAAVTVTGSVGASPPSTSTVSASSNGAAGVWIEQTPGTSAKNTLTGLVCTTSSQGNGLRIVPGSNVTVRSGWFLGNTASGIDIENAAGGAGSAIGNIDLGTAASPGANVVQAPPGGSVNGNAGICLAIAAGAGVQLNARGNVFGGSGAAAVNCASGSGVLRTVNNLKCANHADVGGAIVAFPNDAAAGNTIDVTGCSY
jgi:hypothetical protein